MGSSNNSYIIVEESLNLNDDAPDSSNTGNESADAFGRVMEKQGITIETSENDPSATTKNLADFSRELLDQGGVEIVPNEDDVDEDKEYSF